MNKESITRKDLDQVIRKLSNSVEAGFKATQTDLNGTWTELKATRSDLEAIRNSFETGFKTAKKERQIIQGDVNELGDVTRGAFDLAQKDRDQIKQQIKDLMLFEVGKLKKDMKHIENRLAYLEEILAI